MSKANTTPQILKDDPWLQPYAWAIENRMQWFADHLEYIQRDFGSLLDFAGQHHYLGFNYDNEQKGWWYREWAPKAHYVSLIGDFNGWDRHANALNKAEYGVWETFLPDAEYGDRFTAGSLLKVHIHADNGQHDRIPAFVERVVQNEQDHSFSGQLIAPSSYQWKNEFKGLPKDAAPMIYECHTGMALEKEGVGTYREFADLILPKIAELGYNTIQMMAVQEHPYYGSFGYHVSNFYAPSSRFGDPDELRYLIDTAHGLGIAVVMDIVHSHAVKNQAESLTAFDGHDELYFINGEEGIHPDWDSKLFDYGKVEVQRFLLSNVRYWLEEFHFDGFRFDGVTSMLYHHHGRDPFGGYEDYFNDAVNNSAVLYLQMANALIKEINPLALSIAEDMSGMPGSCRTLEDGGLGFDYRLAMGLPDYWIDLLETTSDDDWHMGDMYWRLTNRRWKEKNIAYCESHDQALVGDKTIAFWLMDKEMYTGMSVFQQNAAVDRGISLHKMIRLVTLFLGGEGYLNFMGNEFGHPEWVDFPREGNNWSYQYARRQWSLPETEHLRYKELWDFDVDMIHQFRGAALFSTHSEKLHEDNSQKILVAQRDEYIGAFNFHPTESYTDYEFYVPQAGVYELVLHTDNPKYGGFDRLKLGTHHHSRDVKGVEKISVYLPSRSALILKKIH